MALGAGINILLAAWIGIFYQRTSTLRKTNITNINFTNINLTNINYTNINFNIMKFSSAVVFLSAATCVSVFYLNTSSNIFLSVATAQLIGKGCCIGGKLRQDLTNTCCGRLGRNIVFAADIHVVRNIIFQYQV